MWTNEQEFNCRYHLLLCNCGTRLLQLLAEKALDRMGMTLSQYLNANAATIKNNRKLTAEQKRTLFPGTMQGASVKDCDITLLSFLIQTYFNPQLDPPEQQAVEQLRTIRNNHAHSAETEMTAEMYTDELKSLLLVINNGSSKLSKDKKEEMLEIEINAQQGPLHMQTVHEIKEYIRLSRDDMHNIQQSSANIKEGQKHLTETMSKTYNTLQDAKNEISGINDRTQKLSLDVTCVTQNSMDLLAKASDNASATDRISAGVKEMNIRTEQISEDVAGVSQTHQQIFDQVTKVHVETHTINVRLQKKYQEDNEKTEEIIRMLNRIDQHVSSSGFTRSVQTRSTLVDMATAHVPVISEALHQRVQVAAIDFGTTYSGYAFSIQADLEEDPLKIQTFNWKGSSTPTVSLKTPSCILFDDKQNFHSFGYEAEKKYADLAADEEYIDWFYFKWFKMMLYQHERLRRDVKIKDDKGLMMPAMKVFSAGIQYLKDHLIKICEKRKVDLKPDEVHWVLTVPAIWDDSAKQFMREAAIKAGIETKTLSLALEPEAASLYCRYLPLNKVQGEDGTDLLSSMTPQKRYLVLDAGGGTVDITVHETLADGTVRELYKANGGPWGGTKIDEAYLTFLKDILGEKTVHKIQKDFKKDYLDLFTDFEVRKKTFDGHLQARDKITFKIASCVHETYFSCTGHDLRRSLMMKQDLSDQITFTGDKLRVKPELVEQLFDETCNHIVAHLKDIFSKPEVAGTETILMVGGFSESLILQKYIRTNFPDKRIIIPEDAGLAVLKGAVIFGHSPRAILSRVAKNTYGVEIHRTFIQGVHPDSKKVVIEGEEKCKDCFDIHVRKGDKVLVGQEFQERCYFALYKSQIIIELPIFTSTKRDPEYTDDKECSSLGKVLVDVSKIEKFSEKNVAVKLIYGNTELQVVAKVEETGEMVHTKLNFLG